MDHLDKAFSIGKVLKVYYNPENPQQATLTPNVKLQKAWFKKLNQIKWYHLRTKRNLDKMLKNKQLETI